MGGGHDEQRSGDALDARQAGHPAVQQPGPFGVQQSVNYGISGAGTINAGNLAIGPHSRIEVSVEDSPLAPQLDALAKAIAAFDGPEEKRTEMLATHRDIADELHSTSRPDRHKLLSKLATIASAAGSAGAIASAAEALGGAIQHLL